ncbi:hypothetical protein D2V93_08705 [Flagellimonas taeanensis]|jgi:hypothetical protein|uniref:DUF3221 domain-containing protein n=1 Tax=Flagellimonas taeanensis TaxID=1005926 RepID=A0A1M6UXW1_9FLAO|nr:MULTISPECIES: hypothetical protein [Allomuricauda]MDC6385782.1 hypothetical protein [Muricauda sp. SK9]MEE1963147.1 hypothetical protein [Allomuricauda taeanensis]RIV50934.1 hypothetical protein D2V93_08705 [Allomuricauda taeanensis]SFC22577.1 hypothetical protein SAMN04487891_107191 [Allomuricauda taeanensis]SHK73886.1 hypothetical protein SAMN05216293_1814 [Allomuricauda taeanensis]
MYRRILGLLLFWVISCNSPIDAPIFSITKIEQGKDGKTLFLEDAKGTVYTTVISIPNGNYVDVEVGDRVQLEINEILEDMDPIIIVSKSVTVLE